MHRIPEHVDVVIVGGGIAGLYTALRYLEIFPNTSIVLLEASSKLGGRLQTYYSKNKTYQYEIGGSRFNQHHRKLLSLIKKYKCTKFPIGSHKTLCTHDKSIDESSLHKMPTTFKQVPVHILKNITFGEYLDTYYSKENRRFFQTQFGYDGEFDIMNAYDAIRIFERDFTEKSQYYMLEEGMSELIRRMKDDFIHKGGLVFTKCPVTHFEFHASRFKIYIQPNKQIHASKVFFALPKQALLTFDQFKKSHWINAVEGIPLQRVYGQFTPHSTYIDQRFTTDNPLRQYIPVNPSLKIAMISYSDTQIASKWHNAYQKNQSECTKEYLHQLTRLNEQCGSTSSNTLFTLKWLRPYYWEYGVHLWKKHIDSLKMHQQSLIPLGRRTACYIVGEAYSIHQGWIEGALETVDEVFEKYL